MSVRNKNTVPVSCPAGNELVGDLCYGNCPSSLYVNNYTSGLTSCYTKKYTLL